jgi:hypothetical protein
VSSERALPARLEGQLDIDEVFALGADEDNAPTAAAATGELVGELETIAAAFVATLADVEQTQRTYRQACARFLAWLEPGAGPEALTLHTLAAYQAHLAAPDLDGRRRSSATVRKHRAALNSGATV